MLKGSKYNYLTVISSEKEINNRYFVDCICDCGNKATIRKDKLKSGHTKSCGCLQKSKISALSKTHGLSKTRLYRIWSCMKSRCCNKTNTNYKYYGGRGIAVYKEWIDNPESFIDWANNNGYSPELELDRKDNDKDYSPKNCRWITHAENSRNQRLLRSTNKSGYRGVSFVKRVKKYKASITYNYKEIHIGYFKTAKEAANARDEYIITNNINLPLNNPL